MEVLKLFLSAVCVAACFSFVSCGVKSEKIVLDNGSYIEMVKIPDTDYSLCTTEIPQDFYQALTGENPSGSKGERLPVEKVSWFDAVVFCNKLSIVSGKTPVYSINGVTDPEAWGYVPHQHKAIEDKIIRDLGIYAKPKEIVFVDSLPHTFVGKIDVNKLS